MENAMVFPDVRSEKNKEIKQQMILVDKVYSPFLSKFFDKNGIIPRAIQELQTEITTRLARLIDILEEVFDLNQEENEEGKKGKPKPDEEKKKKETDKRWYKIIKGKWFEKAAGFLSRLASVNFLTQLVAFIILLRMGLLQMVLPWLLEVVEEAITSIIKALPAIAKFFWHILWVTIPGILKQIFREIFKALGIENKALLAFGDTLAKVLPLILAIGFIWHKIGPTLVNGISLISKVGLLLSKIGGVLGSVIKNLIKLGPMLAKFGKILFSVGWGILKVAGSIIWSVLSAVIPALFSFLFAIGSFVAGLLVAITPFLLMAAPFIAIAAALFLLWKYAEQISDFFDTLIDKFKSLSTGMKILVGVLSLVFFPITMAIGLIYGLVKAFKFFKQEGFLKGLQIIWQKIKDFFSYLGTIIAGFFSSIWNLIKRAGNVVKEVFTGFVNWVGEIFSRMWDSIKNAWGAVTGFFSDIGSGISEGFSSAKESVGGFFSNMQQKSIENNKAINEWLTNSITTPLMNAFSSIGTYIKGYPSRIMSGIKNIQKSMKKVATRFVGLLTGMISSFLSPFKSIFDGLKKITSPVMGVVGPLLTKLGDFVSSIGSKLSSVYEKVKSGFNSLMNWFDNITTYGAYDWSQMKKSGEAGYVGAAQKYIESTPAGELIEKVAKGEVKLEAAMDQVKGTAQEKAEFASYAQQLKDAYSKETEKSLDGKSFAQWLGSMQFEKKDKGREGGAFVQPMKRFEINEEKSATEKALK